MKFVFKYYDNGGEVRPTPGTKHLVMEMDYVIAIDCLDDIISEARAMQRELIRRLR